MWAYIQTKMLLEQGNQKMLMQKGEEEERQMREREKGERE